MVEAACTNHNGRDTMKPYDYDGSLDAAIKIHLRAALLGGDQDFVAALMATVNPTIIARLPMRFANLLGLKLELQNSKQSDAK
jgi:hypothetical protein